MKPKTTIVLAVLLGVCIVLALFTSDVFTPSKPEGGPKEAAKQDLFDPTPGKPVRLRFQLKDADLYSIQFLQQAPVKAADAKPTPAKLGLGQSMPMFDGKTLAGWKILKEVDFEDHGKVYVQENAIVLDD